MAVKSVIVSVSRQRHRADLTDGQKIFDGRHFKKCRPLSFPKCFRFRFCQREKRKLILHDQFFEFFAICCCAVNSGVRFWARHRRHSVSGDVFTYDLCAETS